METKAPYLTNNQNGVTNKRWGWRIDAIVRYLQKHPEVLLTDRGHIRFLWDGKTLKVASGETETIE